MKKSFDKKVRWDFKVASHGYGRNVKEALIDYVERLAREIEMEFSDADLEAIEEHEVSAITENDFEEDE